MTNQANSPPNMKLWRFVVPLVFQGLLILAVPAQAIYTSIFGQTVILQTLPVDPYDLLRGYSQTLRYEISPTSNLKTLPGWDTLSQRSGRYLSRGTKLYVILAAPDSDAATANQKPPTAWEPIAVSSQLPTDLPTGQVAIAGSSKYSQVEYGLETYYMPEDRRDRINREIGQIRRRNAGEQQAFVVEVKVDRQGRAVPISLWVGDRNYRF